MKVVSYIVALWLPIWMTPAVHGLAGPKKIAIKTRPVSFLETVSGIKVTDSMTRPPLSTTPSSSSTLVLPKKHPQQENAKPMPKSAATAAAPLQLSSVFLDQGKNYDEEYWYHPQIHTLGNAGIFGAVHAALAPLSTYIIDTVAYNGVDIRMKVAQELRGLVNKGEARVLDMCCGVGMSTRALRTAFPDAQAVIGLDTSPQMVAMANFMTKHLAIVLPVLQQIQKRFSIGMSLLEEQKGKWKTCTGRVLRRIAFKKANAESTKLPDKSFDLVTVMYAFHEAPKMGRERIVKEARRLLAPGGILAIIDISSDYTPSPSMLAGEPYVIEYQQNMNKQLRTMKGFLLPEYKTVVPGHVGMWTLRRSYNAV